MTTSDNSFEQFNYTPIATDHMLPSSIPMVDTAGIPNAVANVLHHTETVNGMPMADVQTAPEKTLSTEQQTEFFTTLKDRFTNEQEYTRPAGVTFEQVENALKKDPTAMYKLYQLEQLGGHVDVMAVEGDTLVFAEMSKEAPQGAGRRNISYKEAVQLLETIGVTMMTPEEYKDVLQTLGTFNRNTWIWLQTDEQILKDGGALCGLRYVLDVFVRQGDAQSCYDVLGVRAVLRVQS